MPQLKFDRPEPELTEQEDAETLAAIEEGIREIDAGQGISIEELRQELLKRCSD
jgi:hypothetical protein